ncbi:HEAT repeat domain-containing protein [Mesorhizobium sp. LSHC412B00]|uniref:HEAT repeat domain-containing protein n=1 Tax=Mesorhizobium sp. LSHC412B00 TaxID=1287285 RepID=UPI0012EC056D|nr:HEAT repeat domain-containing protein [Mesorhizobium sp. LSHC412B00]
MSPVESFHRPRIASLVVRQHAELVAFLWVQRESLLAQEPPAAVAAKDIDDRIEANLDGLRIAGQAAWPSLLQQLQDYPDSGELFAFAWTAIEFNDPVRLSEAVGHARELTPSPDGFIGALRWHAADRIGPHVRDWITDADAFKRFLGVSACLVHSVDPKNLLPRLARDPDPRVRAAGLRLVGVLKRTDLAGEANAALNDSDEDARFWSAWSLVELGHARLAQNALRAAVEAPGKDRLIALRAAIKSGPETEVRAWLGGLMQSPQTASIAVRSIGMLGDRGRLAWLVERMREPPVSIAAGASFAELFPEAPWDELSSAYMEEVGPDFIDYFSDSIVRVPLADKVAEWGKTAGVLRD